MKKLIASSYDIGFLCSNMRIEANRAIYGIKYQKHDFEIQTSKLVRQIRNAHTRAHYLIRNSIAAFYHIEFSCSNMKIEANGGFYDINCRKYALESWAVRHEGKSKLVPQMRNAQIRACE